MASCCRRLLVLTVATAAKATILGDGAPATIRAGSVHVEEGFAPAALVSDLRSDVAALSNAGLFGAAGSGGRAGAEDTLRSAEFCDPVHRNGDRSIGDFEAFVCLWERLDLVRQELATSLECELLPEMEVHYVRYPASGFYGRHLDDYEEDIFDVTHASRASRRRLSFICYLTDDGWTMADGGLLRAYDQGEDGQHEDHLPTGGKLVVFDSCRVEHEVLPTTRERVCLIGWFHEPASSYR